MKTGTADLLQQAQESLDLAWTDKMGIIDEDTYPFKKLHYAVHLILEHDGECACLVGTIEKAGGRTVIERDASRLAEKWYMGISKGHTPENNTNSKSAVLWIDNFLAAQSK